MRKNETDLAIIGGGILGLYTAVAAKKRWPDLSVAVYEKSMPGDGASRFAPGIQIAYGRSSEERELARLGIEAWEQVFETWNWRPGRKIPIQWITNNPEKIQNKSLETLTERTLVNTTGVEGLTSQLQPSKSFEGTCSYDPVLCVIYKLTTEFIALGGEIYSDTDMCAVDSDDSNYLTLTDSDGCHYFTQKTIVTLGPWITHSPLRSLCHAAQQVRVKKVVAFELDIAPSYDDPALGLTDDYAFILPMHKEKKWLISFCSDHWDVSPNDRFCLIPKDSEKVDMILKRYFQSFEHEMSPLIFCDAYLPDGIPKVESSDYDTRIVFILGAGGNGFRFAPPIAEAALEHVDL